MSLETLNPKRKWKWESNQLCTSTWEEENGEDLAEVEVGREMGRFDNQGASGLRQSY